MTKDTMYNGNFSAKATPSEIMHANAGNDNDEIRWWFNALQAAGIKIVLRDLGLFSPEFKASKGRVIVRNILLVILVMIITFSLIYIGIKIFAK